MSRPRIRVLDRIVADQIAAGEVVDRPASVVKELVENSVDAGATRVQVEIDGGGARLIRVLDNGCGLSDEELELAFERHATSKIQRITDLEQVRSFGFRGEALPSIASVSRILIESRTAEAVAGVRLEIAGGERVERRACGCPVGTDISVRDLFFNTPARLKFLKRESTEAGHCAEALIRLALVRPEVAFRFSSGGRRRRELPRVERIEERVAALFPDEALARTESTAGPIEVLAVLGPPERARAGAGSLYTYVNGRYVRDRALLRAINQAFAGTLETGRYPAGLLAVTLPGAGLDVNVHPQKTEVRFADQQAVYRAVVRTVGELVARSVWAGGSDSPVRIPEPAALAETPEPYRTADRLVPPPSSSRRTPAVAPRPAPIAERPPGGAVERRPEQLGIDRAEPPSPAGRFAAMRYIGQARGTFLLLEDGEDLVLVDQHAAHERVTYERLRRELERGRISSQRLLAPHQVDLGPAEVERVAEHADQLSRLGLEVSRSGPDRIAIRAVPAEIADAAPDRLLAEMVLALEQSREGSRGELEDRALATLACHGSIRAGRSVDPAEVRALLAEMDTIDFAGHCPHGRPVLARIPWREIARRVGRG